MSGAGLVMEVFNSQGALLGSGEQIRITAAQGEVLTVRVAGAVGPGNALGAGAYTLDVDVLPQVVSVQADPLLPGQSGFAGGPTTSLVITFQGDRLDPASAENPANYTVTWLGPDGVSGTDDKVIPLANDSGFQSVVYDPGANINVATGKDYPTAVRQTVTLFFDQPLPAGSYLIALSPNIESAAFNNDEQDALTAGAFAENHLVSVVGGQIVDGSSFSAANLVANIGSAQSLQVFQDGTAFLTQLHSDLGSLLDTFLTQQGDQSTITATLLDQMLHSFEPALAPEGSNVPPLLVLFLDPVSLDLADPDGNRISYNLQTNSLTDQSADAFVSVASNVEVVVLPLVPGDEFDLNVSNVAAGSRGGARSLSVTTCSRPFRSRMICAGTRDFQFGIPAGAGLQPSAPDPVASGGGSSVSAGLLALVVAKAIDSSVTETVEGPITVPNSDPDSQVLLPPQTNTDPSSKPATRPAAVNESAGKPHPVPVKPPTSRPSARARPTSRPAADAASHTKTPTNAGHFGTPTAAADCASSGRLGFDRAQHACRLPGDRSETEIRRC